MKHDLQLKLQAHLDGELPAAERCVIEQRLESDAEARLLWGELQSTRQVLTGAELSRSVPASREFYWSRIQQEISRQEAAGERETSRPPGPWWRRFLVPAIGVAALALGLSLTLNQLPANKHSLLVDTSLTDSGALTYRDAKEGITLVWLSYPAESGLAETDESDSFE